MRFTVFSNEIAVCFKSKFHSGDAYHANYTQSVYEIYSVLKLFEIAVCSAHFDFFDISTPVMRIMLTMVNLV